MKMRKPANHYQSLYQYINLYDVVSDFYWYELNILNYT